MWFRTFEQEQTERTEKPVPRVFLFPPVRIALAAFALLALDTPRAQSGFGVPLAFDAGSNPVSVAVGDFNGDGIADLVAANHDSNNVSVLLGKGDGTFGAAVNYATGSDPYSVAVGDFNRDGIPDLAVANNGSNNVSVLLGNGDGTFQAAVNYGAGGGPYSVAVADFNGDGIPDLAVANGAGVSVLLGNGDGTFQTAVSYAAAASARCVAVGDFNRDGIADLVVVGGGTLSVLLGNGDGTFQVAVKYTAGGSLYSVAVADLNGDGIPDFAVANTGKKSVSVLLGNGDGTFQTAVNYAAGGGDSPAPRSVVVQDFNGDGVPDLAVASDTVSVLLGNGDGTFQAAVNYAAGLSPTAVAVGDFNGDGKPDLAVAIGGGNNVGVLLGQGGGIFQAAAGITPNAGITPDAVAVGDFNGDGISDLVVANFGGPAESVQGPTDGQGAVSILLGKGDGTFQAAASYKLGLGCLGVAVADFNGDGIADLVVANNQSDNVSLLLGKGDGTFRAAVDYGVSHHAKAVAVGDFNGDGIPDLAVAVGGFDSPPIPGGVNILLGKGDGTFRAAIDHASGGDGTIGLAVADFNGDGIPDLVVASVGDLNKKGQGGSVSVLLGKGDATFQAAVNYTAGLGPESVTVGDFNGDGIPDLAVVNFFSNDVSVLLGKGDGTFQAAVHYAVGPYPGASSSVVVRDFNGDGIPDLAVAFGGGVRVLLGNGDGTFQTTAISYLAGGSYYPGVTYQFNLAVGDFNGDGLPDLAVANVDARSVSILLNDGKWGR